MNARKIIIICVAIFNVQLLSAQSLCEVTAPNIDVMSRPDTASLIVGHLNEHDIITVNNLSKGWATISYNEGTAYVLSNHIAPLDSNDSYYANLLANERIRVEKERQLLEKSRTDSIQKAHKQQQLVKKRTADSIKKANRNPAFIGFNVGLGGSFGKIQALSFSIGTDMAFSCNSKLAIGYFLSYETFTNLNAGILFVHGNYVTSDAFFWGLGLSHHFPYNKRHLHYQDILTYERTYYGNLFIARMGYKTSSLYYAVNLSVGSINIEDIGTHYYYYKDKVSTIGLNFSIGYKLKTKKSVKK